MRISLTQAQVEALRLGMKNGGRVPVRRTFVNGSISHLAVSHKTAEWFTAKKMATMEASERKTEGTLVFNDRAADLYRGYQEQLRLTNSKVA